MAAVQLPEARDAATRARLRRRFPDARESAPPPAIARVVDDIVGAASRRSRRPVGRRPRLRRRAAVLPAGVRGRAPDPARRDAQLRRHRHASRHARLGARRGPGAGQESIRRGRAVPSGARGRRQARRLLGGRRRVDQAAHARHRTGAPGLRLRPGARARARPRIRRGARAHHRAGRTVPHAPARDAGSVRRAAQVDRVPAARRQGRLDHPWSRAGAVPTLARRPDADGHPARAGRQAAWRGSVGEQAAQRARSRAAQRRRRDPDASPKRDASTTRR